MPGVQRITGGAVAVNRANIDTDQIIPASWLKRVERTGFEAGLFGAWRSNPDFPLNRPGAAGARILVAGDNFGCGSSREHAVWALQNFGFAAVVAPGFADIFRGNAISSGLVPAQASADAVAAVFAALEADPDAEVTVDVAGLAVEVPSAGLKAPFELADFARWRLMEGLDDIGLSLRHQDAIAAYEGRRLPWLPAQPAPQV